MSRVAEVPAGWRRALEELVPTPEEHRERTLTPAEAAARLGCGPDLFEALLAAGLRLDEHDVINVGLYSGSGRSTPELAQRALLRFATRRPATWTAPVRWWVAVEHRCLAGEPAGGWALARPAPARWDGRVEAWEEAPGRRLATNGAPGGALADGCASATGTVLLRGRREAVLARDVAALFDEVVAALAGGVPRFQWLPSGLRRDPDAAWRHGVADCVACALRLERELARLGFEARTALGHVLGLVPSEHAWVEVRDADGAWKALDPVLAALGGREPGTDPEFAAFCLGSVCNRLLPWDRTAAEPLAVHACAAPAAGVETTVLSGMAR